MNARAERNTQVTPDALLHRDGEEDREAATAQLAALHARIEAARSLTDAPDDVHCRDCFTRGRDAALRAILGPT